MKSYPAPIFKHKMTTNIFVFEREKKIVEVHHEMYFYFNLHCHNPSAIFSVQQMISKSTFYGGFSELNLLPIIDPAHQDYRTSISFQQLLKQGSQILECYASSKDP